MDDHDMVVAPGVRVLRTSFGAGTCDTAIRVAGRSGDGTLWATDNRNDLWKSSDNLSSWQLAWTAPSEYVQVETVLPLASGHLLIAVRDANGLRHVLRSTDASGTTFGSPVLDIPPKGYLLSNKSWIESGGAIYIAEYGDPTPPVLLWKSTDDGETFFTAYSEPRARHFHAVQADPYDPGRLWLPAGDKPPQSRIGYSTDGGTTFTFITEVSYPRSRAVNLMFTPDAVYWGSDSPDVPSALYRWDRRDGKITRELGNIRAPFYFAVQAKGAFAQFTAVEDAAEHGYSDSQSILILSSTGSSWSVTKSPWMRAQDDPTRNSVITGITEPDSQGRFWAAFWNLDGAQYRSSNIEFQLDPAAVDPNAPTASFDPPPGPHVTGQALAFNGSSSTSSAQPLTFSWDFGDGATDTAANPFHAYASAGSYAVALQVTDPNGDTNETTRTVTIDPSPSPGPASPSASLPIGTAGPMATVPVLRDRTTVTVRSSRARVRRGAAQIAITCRGVGRCRGSMTLTRAKKSKPIGKALIDIPAGRTRTIRVPLNARGRLLLSHHRRGLATWLTISLRRDARFVDTRQRFTLFAAAR